MPSRKRMAIQGMTCDQCEHSVALALESAGATDVEVSYHGKRALFSGGDDVLLIDALRNAGYRPGPIERLPHDPVPRFGSPHTNGRGAFDLLVLGSGSSAFAAAIRASDAGARVALVERGAVGGTCVNVGCVPSKALLRAAELQHLASSSPIPGLSLHADPVNLDEITAWKNQLVKELRQTKYIDLVDAYGFELVAGTARFEGPDSVSIGEERVTAEAFLIATGAAPAIPELPGLVSVDYLTNDTVLELTELPRHLIVLGGGPEGLEFAQAFRRLGSRVTIVGRNRYLAPQEDHDVSLALAEALRDEGIDVLTGTAPSAVRRTKAGVVVTLTTGVEVEGDKLLVATGRRPNTQDLQLELAGVSVDERGAVVVDEQLRTTNPRIFAAGDVTGAPQYVYVAAYAGALAADNAISQAGRTFDLTALPRVTFTSPQVASVGLTESDALARGIDVKTSVLPITSVPRAIVNQERHGLVKLVAEKGSDRLIGAHVLADGAGDVIQSAVLAIKFGLTVSDLADTFHPYLTTVEGLKLAAQTFDRDVNKLSCCAA